MKTVIIVDAKFYSRLINNIMRWKFRIVIMASWENALAIKNLIIYKQGEQSDMKMQDRTQSSIVALSFKANKTKYSSTSYSILHKSFAQATNLIEQCIYLCIVLISFRISSIIII